MMLTRFSRLLDRLSEFIAHRKGLLPLIGILLILVNFTIQFIPWFGWFSESNLLLHLGLVISIIGFLLAWAL
jgi:hypothetical protein